MQLGSIAQEACTAICPSISRATADSVLAPSTILALFKIMQLILKDAKGRLEYQVW